MRGGVGQPWMALMMNVGRAGRFVFNRTALRSFVNKQFEMRRVIAPTVDVKPTTLPPCNRTLIRKGVECAKKAVEQKVENVKAKLPKQASATAQAAVLKF